jgi:hypothetical protein
MKMTRSLMATYFKMALFALCVALMTNTASTASASSNKFSLRDFDGAPGHSKNDDNWCLDKPGRGELKLKDCDAWDNQQDDWDRDLSGFLDLLNRHAHDRDFDDLREKLFALIAYLLKHGHHPHCPPVSP